MNSTADRTPLDAPSIELPGGVKVFATRNGDHVVGRVTFPYAVGGRTSAEINYHNTHPFDISNLKSAGPLDAKALARLKMVQRWRTLCVSDRDVTRLEHARRVGCPLRTLQAWERKLETEGEAGLANRYEPAPRKVLSLDAALAKDAITICAWWCFRIGNADVIDSKMMHSAASIRPRAEYMRDILATIESYFSWPTDRAKMPFKPFPRWAKWDFDKWLYRALSAPPSDISNLKSAVPLQPPLTVIPRDESTPDSKVRKREVRNFATRRAIASLAPPNAAPLPYPCHPERSEGSLPAALLTFPDHHRWMLIRAARGDADAVNQAVVTMPIWWDKLPEQLRNNIDARADAWKREHPTVTNYAVAGRKLAMLGPSIRRPPKGPVSGCELLELAV